MRRNITEKWTRIWDETSHAFYLFNDTTGESKWDEEMQISPQVNLTQPQGVKTKSTGNHEDWVRMLDESSGAYFLFNEQTGESKWEPGALPNHEQQPPQSNPEDSILPPGWCEYYDLNEKKYYYNEVTGEYAWLKPGEIPSVEHITDPEFKLSTQKSLKIIPASMLDTSSIYEGLSDLEAELGEGSLDSSDAQQLQKLRLGLASVRNDLDKIELEANDGGSINDETAEQLVGAISDTSVAITWHWPWSVFYDLKRKRYFYYHEINQTMEAEPPVDVVFPSPLAVLAVHENLRCSCLELLHRRVRLIRPNANRITEVELAEELFGPMVIIQDPIEPKAYSTHLDIEELLEVNLSYHKSRYGRQAKWTRGWKAAYGILRTLRSMKRIASTAQTLLLTPTSRPYTQSSAPVSRLVSTATKAKLHVGGFFSAAKGLHSPETLSTSRQIDPVSKTSLIKIIVISIWNSLNKKENVTLRNEVFSKHFMISIIRQRNLFEGCRTSGEELDLDANALGTSSILSPPRSLTSSVAVALKRLPMGSSLDNTLVSYFEAEQKFHAPEFERNLSNEDYTHYQSILGDVNQAPQSVEPLLHLVGFLFNCGADMPATRCLKKIIDDLPLYKLVEVEKTYIEILHLHCVTKVMGRYPRAHTLKDLATKHPTDAGVLALVATELAALQYIQDAETYYIASLLREPINNAIALRGYALLLANIKGDYAGALRYLSRISPQICDAGVLGVIKLETAWCSELAGNNDCISLQYYSSIAIHATPKTILSLVHSCMAAILIRKKDYIHACEYLIKALKLFSDNPHALIQHACLRLHRGIEHTRICDEYFLRGVDLLESLKFPTLWLVRLAYGDFKAFAMNDFIAAETLYRKSAYCRKSILPIIAYTQNLLLCKQSNDIIQANLDWARSILNFLKPSVDVSFALVSIACVCVHMGEMDKAMALLGGLKGNDGYVLGSAHRCQAYLASKMDHRKEAANHLENALSVGSVNPAVLRSCAAQYASIGEFQRAYELISRATEVDYHEPHSWEMQAILAYLLEADLSHCLTFLDMSLGIIFDFDVFRLRGQVLFETGRVTEARETLEAALRHKPKDAICLISLILVYEAMWRKEKGTIRVIASGIPKKELTYKHLMTDKLQQFNEVIREDLPHVDYSIPADVYFRAGMFYLNYSKKTSHKAKKMFLRGGKWLHPLCIYMLGWILETEGSLQQAEDLYLKVIQFHPHDPVMFNKLDLMAKTTHQYVSGLLGMAQSNLKDLIESSKLGLTTVRRRLLKAVARKERIIEGLVLRVLIHERLSKKLHDYSSISVGTTELKGTGRVFIDPLWTTRFQYIFARQIESWASFLTLSNPN